MIYYVYFLYSNRFDKYYVGVSNNVVRRLMEHNSGLSKSTAPLRPFVLLRVERFNNINEAYLREKFIKLKKSKKILQKIINSSPDVLAEQEVGIPIRRSRHRDSVGRAPLS